MSRDFEKDREICSRATEGPWRFPSWREGAPDEDGYAHIRECDTMEPTGIQHTNGYEGYWHDWRFIQESRLGWPAALAEIARLQGEVERKNRALQAIVDAEVYRTFQACPDCDTPRICNPRYKCERESMSEKIARAALLPPATPRKERRSSERPI